VTQRAKLYEYYDVADCTPANPSMVGGEAVLDRWMVQDYSHEDTGTIHAARHIPLGINCGKIHKPLQLRTCGVPSHRDNHPLHVTIPRDMFTCPDTRKRLEPALDEWIRLHPFG